MTSKRRKVTWDIFPGDKVGILNCPVCNKIVAAPIISTFQGKPRIFTCPYCHVEIEVTLNFILGKEEAVP